MTSARRFSEAKNQGQTLIRGGQTRAQSARRFSEAKNQGQTRACPSDMSEKDRWRP
jgi:hypothetical protein